ncbi:hypothetical protein M6I34_00150 [Burkholderiaceae bacterium FT117]|uniref:hypothetical protein n=1 Tax=Zeimonas sediminis TaxID=2944268 RepID=UPI0023430D3F|nr:hypothetical protein [Zeimonas sediminis]MCM5568912.1 hypothetical protein [Zeimonas sediminis]
MTITILCAGALALPGGADDDARPALLARHAPPDDGAAARLLARARAAQRLRDDSLTPSELPDEAWLRARFAAAPGTTIAAHAAHALAGGDAVRGAAPAASGALAAPPVLPDSPTLLVRPVHLHVGLDHLVLATPQAGEIGADEAAALAGAANRLFADDGLVWSPEAPHAWTLKAASEAGRARLNALAGLACRSARLASGRNIDAWQPEGEAARQWRAIVNELQMLWFEHPVNLAREADGRPALNSVWLEGSPGVAGRRAFDAVVTADDAVAGLSLSAGSEVSALDPLAPPEDFARLVAIQENAEAILLDPGWWRVAVARADAEAWREAWLRLDSLVGRLAAAGERVQALVLAGERDLLEFAPGPADRWAVWRRRSLAGLLAGCR